jgi:hypothetical protein
MDLDDTPPKVNGPTVHLTQKTINHSCLVKIYIDVVFDVQYVLLELTCHSLSRGWTKSVSSTWPCVLFVKNLMISAQPNTRVIDYTYSHTNLWSQFRVYLFLPMPKKNLFVFRRGCNQKQHEPLSKQNTLHDKSKNNLFGWGFFQPISRLMLFYYERKTLYYDW